MSDELRGSWKGCRMINPMCPNDYCDLPPHPGPGQHRMTTMMTPDDYDTAWLPMLEVPPGDIIDGAYVQIWDLKTIIDEGCRIRDEEESLTASP